MPPRGRGGRKLAQIRAEDNEEGDDNDPDPVRKASPPPPATVAAAAAQAELAAKVRSVDASAQLRRCRRCRRCCGLPADGAWLAVQDDKEGQLLIAEQPLSEAEREQVKRYRELQRFLKNSPFYVRPPRQSEHADLARYSDQYQENSDESASLRLADYVARTSETKCRAFPAELLTRHAKRQRRMDEREASRLARLAQPDLAAEPDSDEDEEVSEGARTLISPLRLIPRPWPFACNSSLRFRSCGSR